MSYIIIAVPVIGFLFILTALARATRQRDETKELLDYYLAWWNANRND